jgi:hypothetical protein
MKSGVVILIIIVRFGLQSHAQEGGTSVNSTPVSIGNKEQLFLDDYIIQGMSNVQRVMHAAEKYPGNPVIWPSEPWENRTAVTYGSVLKDNGKYKIWYKVGDASEPGGVGYAESKDGIHWNRPLLNNVLVAQQKTNMLFKKQGSFSGPAILPSFYELFGVYKDERDPDPSRRYKMGFLSIRRPYKGPRADPFHPTDHRGLGVAGSADGIHWKLIDSFATEAICDGATHWMIDPVTNKYVLYGRTKKTLPEIERAWSGYPWYKGWHSGRSVARIESSDFLHWDFKDPATAPVVMTADTLDQPGTEIYSMLVFPYESVYIGLVQAYIARPDANYLEIQLAVSHDSYSFTRVGGRKAFIPVGPVGSWDRFNNSLSNNAPFIDGDLMRFYYGGRMYQHTPYKGPNTAKEGAGIGFATLKRGRFVSLESSFDGGTVTTKPLFIKGAGLELNANCRFGTIRITLIDSKGNEMPGWTATITGKDNIAIPVLFANRNWKEITAQAVSVRFRLSNAQLFGFRVSGK